MVRVNGNEDQQDEQGKAKKQATVVDVAREAGVSIATVSNVLNRRNVPLAEETIRKVEEAAQRIGYRKNVAAASLSRKRTLELGLLLPSFGGYYGRFAEVLERHAHECGYRVTVSSSLMDPSLEQRHLEALLERRVDGIVCHGLAMSPDSARTLVGEGTPIVLFNAWNWPEDMTAGVVNMDVSGACADAVERLSELGCRTILYLEGGGRSGTAVKRRLGFEEGVKRLAVNRTLTAEIVQAGRGLDRISTEARRGDMDPSSPIGVIGFDDSVACAFMIKALEQGWRIPDQLKIIGMNDDSFAANSYPGLSSYRIDYSRQAKWALGLLLSQIDDKWRDLPEEARAELLPPHRHVEIPLPYIGRRSSEAR